MHPEGQCSWPRSVIEATAKDKGMTGRDVVTKIDAMYEARLIREDIRDGAHMVRYLANDAAHQDFADLVPQADVELILNLMDEVLEEVLPPSLFEHPAAELSVDDSAQLCEDHRQPDHIA